jgi:uncharacterized protein with HEPN domain
MLLFDMQYIFHIHDEYVFLLEGSSRLDREIFLRSPMEQRAFVRSLEIIGEATKHLSNEIKQEYPSIPWREVAGTRDKLIHNYMEVDYDLVWKITTSNIPQLYATILEIISNDQLNT